MRIKHKLQLFFLLFPVFIIFSSHPAKAQGVNFLYDSGGQRIARTKSGGEHTYYISGGLEVIVNPDGLTSWRKTYALAGNTSAVREGSTANTTGVVYYIYSDHLGSASLVTNSSGNTVAKQRYYPYGATRVIEGVLPTDKEYTGQVSDMDQTGLYYYNARYYDPLLAKFTQADTVNDGLNRYAYVGNNPVNRIDPTGNAYIAEAGGGGGKGKSDDIFTRALNVFSSIDNNISSPDDYENDPLLGDDYSTWRLLVAGSPCTACHVTHTLTQNGIPTNDEINLNQVESYRSLDPYAISLHLFAFSTLANMASLSDKIITDYEYWRDQYQLASNVVRNDLVGKGESLLHVGNPDHYERFGLKSAMGTYAKGRGIIMRATGNFQQMTETLHHEYLHFLESRSWPSNINTTINLSARCSVLSGSEHYVYGKMLEQPYTSQLYRIHSKLWFNYFNNAINNLKSPIQTWMGYVGPFSY